MNVVLWVIVPYICLAVFVVGHYWRYRYDKFGWTTRSSQLYERRLLRWGSPLFHFGLLGVVVGHVVGLLVPQSWTDALGISNDAYHAVALSGGIVFGLMTVAGLAILVYRRRTVGPVFTATTVMDKVMYAFLGVVIALGMWNTIISGLLHYGGEYNYREGVSLWFRGIWTLHPDADLMASAPLGFQIHALVATLLFAHVAVHPARPRLQRARRVPHPAVHRLPLPRRPSRNGHRHPRPGPRLGAPDPDEGTSMSDLEAAEREWQDWIRDACTSVGVDPDLVDVPGVHALTRDIAHGFSRPMAPVGAFIWGVALGQATANAGPARAAAGGGDSCRW